MTSKVVVLGAVDPSAITILTQRPDIECQIVEDVSEPNLCRVVKDADGILVRTTKISETVIQHATKLKVVSRHGVGFDNIDVKALTKKGIPLALAVGSNDDAVSEQAMFLILALSKQGFLYHEAVHKNQFDFRQRPSSISLEGKSILIVGFGRTGSQVAARAGAFKMKVYALDPYIDQSLIERTGATSVRKLGKILPEIDMLTLHCPLSDETRYMINKTALAQMKHSAFIINTARGGIINELDLFEALRDHQIAGAGLDVFEEEPPRRDNPLLHLPNVVLSPHCAGVTHESLVKMGQISAINVLAGLDGCLTRDVLANPESLQTCGN